MGFLEGFLEGGNQALSEHRAACVVRFLCGRGVGGDQLVPVGYGDSMPVQPNASRAGKAANRRVEFHVLEAETAIGMDATRMDAARRRGLADDGSAIASLRRLVVGDADIPSSRIRRSAARLLLSCGTYWHIERLLWLGLYCDGGPGGTRGGQLQKQEQEQESSSWAG